MEFPIARYMSYRYKKSCKLNPLKCHVISPRRRLKLQSINNKLLLLSQMISTQCFYQHQHSYSHLTMGLSRFLGMAIAYFGLSQSWPWQRGVAHFHKANTSRVRISKTWVVLYRRYSTDHLSIDLGWNMTGGGALTSSCKQQHLYLLSPTYISQFMCTRKKWQWWLLLGDIHAHERAPESSKLHYWKASRCRSLWDLPYFGMSLRHNLSP
jgi:hypothetical protein